MRGHWGFKPRQPDFNPRLCLLSLFDFIWSVVDLLFEWSEWTIRWIPYILSNLVILVIFFCIWKSRASVRTTMVGSAALKGPLRGPWPSGHYREGSGYWASLVSHGLGTVGPHLLPGVSKLPAVTWGQAASPDHEMRAEVMRVPWRSPFIVPQSCFPGSGGWEGCICQRT